MYETQVRHAVALAREAKAAGDGPFGALILDDSGRVLAEGRNRVQSEGLSTRHAEICAIESAELALGRAGLAGCTLVASAEPCPMCAGAIHWAGLSRVVFGASIARIQAELPDGGRQIPLSAREVLAGRAVEVIGPLLEEEALQAML
ncbi:MAG: nucleoside deaminase [Chromatiaceae bacterium]|jgi:tRNA(Arg) A34 adenosine deaminase TadA|nr:nucleoside deaminase [Chromatiaceae bacterium]